MLQVSTMDTDKVIKSKVYPELNGISINITKGNYLVKFDRQTQIAQYKSYNDIMDAADKTDDTFQIYDINLVFADVLPYAVPVATVHPTHHLQVKLRYRYNDTVMNDGTRRYTIANFSDFILDTGATNSSLSRSLITNNVFVNAGSHNISTAGGVVTVDSVMAVLDISNDIEPLEINKFRIKANIFNTDFNLLGWDILKHYTITLDMETGALLQRKHYNPI